MGCIGGDMAKFTGPDICAKSAVEVVHLLRRGDIGPDELIAASLQRIAAVDPLVNAVPTLCEDRARAAAKSLTGNKDHPAWLAGLPIGIKDLSAVQGVRTTYGTKGYSDFIPEVSDPLVQQLERRGAIVLGKTNTPEMGAGGNTFNDVFGPTFNAWDTSLNAGGSSGGAAVSLATGSFWLAQGSDHGGSLRTPAAFNGIVGLRPSPGRAGGGSSDAGFIGEGVSGPMARSVADCALFLDAMVGFDASAPISYPAPTSSFQDAVARATPKVRIAFAPTLNGLSPVDAEMDAALRAGLAQVEAAGAIIEETCPELPDLERSYHTLRGMMWATLARRMPRDISQHYKKTLAENTAFGQSLTMDDISDANLNRMTIFTNMRLLLNDFDVLACPVTGCMPHKQSEEWVHEVGGIAHTGYMDWLRFAFLATTTGLPAISVPLGLGPRGLPVGLQLIGPPRGEAKLLAVARAVEMAVGGPLGPIDPIAWAG